MAKDLRLEVVTPDRLVLSQEVEYVGAPGIEGEFGIMPNHIPFLSALGVGSLYFKLDGKYYYVFIAGGFAEVSNNKVTILAEIAEKAEDIDLERARRAEQRARERMQKAEDNIAQARAQAALQRAMQRVSCRSTAANAGTCVM